MKRQAMRGNGFPKPKIYVLISSYWSVQFSWSVVSNSLRPHGLQHTRLPCPLPTPGAYSNSCHWVGINLLLLISSLFFLSNKGSTRGFSGGSDDKESSCNSGDLGSIPGLGRSPGEGNGNPLQYSGLEISMDYIVHGIERSWKCLSNFHFHTSQ